MAKVAKVNFIFMTLVALLTLMFAWHYYDFMSHGYKQASLIVVKCNQLLDATIVASLAILLSSAEVTHMHKMLGPEVRVMATKPWISGPWL